MVANRDPTGDARAAMLVNHRLRYFCASQGEDGSAGTKLGMIVGAKCFAAIDQRDRDAGIAGEGGVYIAGEDGSILLHLLHAITPGGLTLSPTHTYRLAAATRPRS